MTTRIVNLVLFLSVFFILTSCAKGDRCVAGNDCGEKQVESGGPVVVVTPPVIPPLNCIATPSKSTVAADETFSITITASGGVGPYSAPNISTSFESSTTKSGIPYDKPTSGSLVVTKTVTIYDSKSTASSCNFTMTVTPSAGSTGNLGCYITPSTTNPKVGVPVEFNIQAWGGTSTSYTFDQFYPGSYLLPVATTLATPGVSNTVRASYTYLTPVTPAPGIKVTNGSNSLWCSMYPMYFSVQQQSLIVSYYRDASDPNNRIHANLTPIGYDSHATLSYSAVTSESGISIQQISSNGVFDIVRNDTLNHSFNVAFTVTGSTGGTVTKNIILSFQQTLNCTLTGPLAVGSGVSSSYTVRDTSASPRSLRITSISSFPGLSAATGFGTTVANVTFPYQGTYSLNVSAVDVISGNACNGGQPMPLTISVGQTLTGCEISTNVPSALVGSPVRVDIHATGGIAPYTVVLTPQGNTSLGINPSGNYGPFSLSPFVTSQNIIYNAAGANLALNATVRDSTGAQVSCSPASVSAIALCSGGKTFNDPFELTTFVNQQWGSNVIPSSSALKYTVETAQKVCALAGYPRVVSQNSYSSHYGRSGWRSPGDNLLSRWEPSVGNWVNENASSAGNTWLATLSCGCF